MRCGLNTITGVCDVEANVEGNSIVAVVKVSPSADQATVNAILGRYAIKSRLEVMS